jgi:VanZ family protein
MLAGIVLTAARRHTRPLIATACLILLAGILEIGQNFSMGRDPTIDDYFASALGAIIGAAVVFAISGTVDFIRTRGSSPPRGLPRMSNGSGEPVVAVDIAQLT